MFSVMLRLIRRKLMIMKPRYKHARHAHSHKQGVICDKQADYDWHESCYRKYNCTNQIDRKSNHAASRQPGQYKNQETSDVANH